MNVTYMPGFTAEAGISGTKSYRKLREDEVSVPFQAIEAAAPIQCIRDGDDLACTFDTPYHICVCGNKIGCHCFLR
jgi:hypothetical protein